jgi:hypothetical protein
MPEMLKEPHLAMASSQFNMPNGLASLVHISPAAVSVTVPIPLSTNLTAWASPDMTSPVRQSIKARAAVVKSFVHISRMAILLDNIE